MVGTAGLMSPQACMLLATPMRGVAGRWIHLPTRKRGSAPFRPISEWRRNWRCR